MALHLVPVKPENVVELQIESLDLEAQGVAHHDGKVVFVQGALPGETVRAEILKRKSSYEKARTVEVIKAACARVEPRCPHFDVCGGCSMQHLEFSSQVAIKARAVEDQLWHIGRLKAERILRPLEGPSWGYRHRARLTCRLVNKKGGMLVGFHEKGSSYVADMQECHVLPRFLSDLLMPLRALLGGLSIADRAPQIEVAVGQHVTAMVLRHLAPLSTSDEQALKAFADRHGVQWWLQSSGPASVKVFYPVDGPQLSYALPAFGITMPFLPTDFTQVNHAINEAMVSQALQLLGVQAHERVADLFCGLGNFSLPLATQAAEVVGVEGAESLTQRAQENAIVNGLGDKTRFFARNLFEVTPEEWESWGYFDRILIDPPREGALALAHALAASARLPKRIVYVSCNPATLARDAAVMVHQGGFVLKAAGAINMFPHTSHVESIAVFEPKA
jgi:23S rRNA (uracil1939-C5)-methyltransferase